MNVPLFDENRENRIRVTSLFYNCWRFLMFQQIILILLNIALIIMFLIPIIKYGTSCNCTILEIILLFQCLFSIAHNIIFHVMMSSKTPMLRCAFLLKQAKESAEDIQARRTLRECKLPEAQDQSLRYPLKLRMIFTLLNIYTIPSFLVQRKRGLLYLKTFVMMSEFYIAYQLIKIFADVDKDFFDCSDGCSAQLITFFTCKLIFSLPSYLLLILVPIGVLYFSIGICMKKCRKRREDQLVQQQVGAFELTYTGKIVGETECGICLMEYVNQDKILTLSCHVLHHFHSSCLQAWLMQSKSCPVCRAELPINQLYQQTLTEQQSIN